LNHFWTWVIYEDAWLSSAMCTKRSDAIGRPENSECVKQFETTQV
jgi:hypothetical protein